MKKKPFRNNTPMTHSQLKNMWNFKNNGDEDGDGDANEGDNNSKRVRIFNKPGYKQRGKIKIDDNTWVDYDYSGKDQTTELHHNDQPNIPRDIFQLPKYPVFRGVISELPDPKVDNLKDMDYYIIKDIKEAFLWKNNESEFFS